MTRHDHVKRLEQVFEKLGEEPTGVDCPAIDGIIDEAEDVAGEVDDKSVLDAALIAAAQAVEHYEMTRIKAGMEGIVMPSPLLIRLIHHRSEVSCFIQM